MESEELVSMSIYKPILIMITKKGINVKRTIINLVNYIFKFYVSITVK
jgi:hypothetical protein